MITEATLHYFKSWKKIDGMRFSPITGLFGTNSSGKTSILQWLLMLKQTAESSDRLQVLNFGDQRDLVELGGFRDIVHKHAKPGQLSWRLSWNLPTALVVKDPQKGPGAVLFQGDSVSLACEIHDNGTDRLRVSKLEYEFAGRRFAYKAKTGKSGFQLSAEGENSFRFVRTQGRAWDLPAPVKFYGFPDQVNSYYQNAGFLADLQLAFENFLERTFYLGPLREYPQRQYTWPGSQPGDMGRRGEKVIEAILAARDRGEKISRGKGRLKWTVEEYVAHWLQKLALIHSFKVKEVAEGSNLYQVHVQKTPHSSDVLITDVGFGISQILPVIVLCYYVPEGSTVILEQPEIHLHPSVQAGLADVFIDAIKVRKVQIILESHSEHLLRRLQRRIAEESEGISKDDVSLYFCDYRDSESQLIPLDLDMYGNIRNWPKDFFGDQFSEIAEMTRAQAERTPA